MRNLLELKVLVVGSHDDDSHVTIEIYPGWRDIGYDEAAAKEFGDPTDEQILSAGQYLAGVLGRLVAAAVPWIDHARQEHKGCQRRVYLNMDENNLTPERVNSCQVGGVGLLNPRRVEGWAPQVYLNVPKGDRKVWLDRVADWLGQIVVGEQ
ncbi:MAG: hypothetical protein M3P93_15230 [Actinomycetota bacterium]|nr:hypothetical protein [Actinomycetota bacterium]